MLLTVDPERKIYLSFLLKDLFIKDKIFSVYEEELSNILKVIFDLPTLNCSNLKLLSKSELDEI